jgi:hypothetical protein
VAVAAARAAAAGHNNFEVIVGGDITRAETLPQQLGGARCYIVMLEVLDNLPHDKLLVEPANPPLGSSSSGHQVAPPRVRQMHVVEEGGEGEGCGGVSVGQPVPPPPPPPCQQNHQHSLPSVFVERPAELQDRWLQLALEIDELVEASSSSGLSETESQAGGRVSSAFNVATSSTSSSSSTSWLGAGLRRLVRWARARHPQPAHERFVPTGSLQMLDTIASRFPHHCLIAADFDKLPPASPAASGPGRRPALNAPVVSSRGGKVDHRSYLDAPGEADIFFATDFEWLAVGDACVAQQRVARASRYTHYTHTHMIS